MRTLSLLALLAALAAAEPDRAVARARAYLERGNAVLAKAQDARTTGQKLRTLRRAAGYLSRAHALARRTTDAKLQADARSTLADALARSAGAYYARKSLPNARREARRALAIDAANTRAKALLIAIRNAEDEDIFETFDGAMALERIRARRAAAGPPLRDRGIARRR